MPCRLMFPAGYGRTGRCRMMPMGPRIQKFPGTHERGVHISAHVRHPEFLKEAGARQREERLGMRSAKDQVLLKPKSKCRR